MSEVVEFSYRLPPDVKGVHYMTNHHWIEVTMKNGEKHFMPAASVVLYECESCGCKILMFEKSLHSRCPNGTCSGRLASHWGEPKLSFLPEDAIVE